MSDAPPETENTCVRLMQARRADASRQPPAACLRRLGRVERHEKRLWRGFNGRSGGY